MEKWRVEGSEGLLPGCVCCVRDIKSRGDEYHLHIMVGWIPLLPFAAFCNASTGLALKHGALLPLVEGSGLAWSRKGRMEGGWVKGEKGQTLRIVDCRSFLHLMLTGLSRASLSLMGLAPSGQASWCVVPPKHIPTKVAGRPPPPLPAPPPQCIDMRDAAGQEDEY